MMKKKRININVNSAIIIIIIHYFYRKIFHNSTKSSFGALTFGSAIDLQRIIESYAPNFDKDLADPQFYFSIKYKIECAKSMNLQRCGDRCSSAFDGTMRSYYISYYIYIY